MHYRQFSRRASQWLAVVASAALLLAPELAWGAGLTARSDALSTSLVSVTTAHVISFTTATGASIGSIGFQFCTTATAGCSVPGGFISTSATLTAQSGATGFSIQNGVNGAPYITRSAAVISGGTPVSYTISNTTNPNTPNQTFYVRITTYTGADGATGPVDTGTVAVSTAQPINLTGVTPEILVFCVGITIAGNCTTATGNSIDFGDFDTLATRSATSQMQATTNAANGYSITVNGTTLASGFNTIAALGVQTASTTGVSQFGLNLRANGTPAIGSEPSGAGSGTYTANYGAADQYRFVTGDSVASAAAPTDPNTFTASYIVNIAGSQAAGVYTATMTYICTAAF